MPAESRDLLPLVRKKVGDFLYSYGTFPDDDFEQREGYETEYQTADGEEGQRYRTEVLVSAEKLVPLFLDLVGLLPERVFVSLERASADLYRRWDEFTSAETSRTRFLEVFQKHHVVFTEDGHLGVGVFAADPPVEVFLGSHKEVVVFAPDHAPVIEVLRRHGVKPCKLDLFYQRDHQHVALTEYRGMRAPHFDYLQVADRVRHALDMSLQQDEDENVDDEGRPLGLVPWHAVVIGTVRRRARSHRRANRDFMQEFGLTAGSRREARELLERRLERDGFALQSLDELFRVDVEALPAHVRPPVTALARAGIWYVGEKTDWEPEEDTP